MGKSKKKKKSVRQAAPKVETNIRKSRPEDFADEVDDFNANRDKILLRNYKNDSEEDTDNEPVPVMDLDSDLDDSSGEDIFAAEERERYENQRARDLELEEKIPKSWRKGDLYGADTEEFELLGVDEQDAEHEEEEAVRLQQLQSQAFDEDDFSQTMLGTVKPDKNKSKKGTKKQAAATASEPVPKAKKSKKKKSKKKAAVASPEDALTAVNEELGEVSLNLGRKGREAVKVTKNRKRLTKEQKLDVVMTDAPEVFALLEDLEVKIKEIQQSLKPTLEQVSSKKLETNKGISFLQVRLQLVLSYLTNLSFLLLLRAEGRSIKDHPVVGQLAQLRVVMEKIKPVDKKLKYQVDKLLKMSTSLPAAEVDEDEDDSDAEQNPLNFKPNPSNLRAATAAQDDDGLYKIARVGRKTFDDTDKVSKAARREERARQRASKSKLVQELRSELYSDRPERVEVYGADKQRGDAHDQERQQYEEDMFMRLAETKKDKAQRKAKNRINAFEDFDDFGDLALLSQASQQAQLPTKRQLQAGSKKKKRPAFEMSDADFMDGLDMFDMQAAATKKKKAKRAAEHPKPVSMLDAQDFNLGAEGDSRAIGSEIMKNRGLTRYRPRDKKNPRVRYRKNFEKAMVVRRAQVKEFKGQEANYGGEATGIKRNIIRSRKLGSKS